MGTVSQLDDFSRQINGWNQLMARRHADLSQASETNQNQPFPAEGAPSKEEKVYPAFNKPSYMYG